MKNMNEALLRKMLAKSTSEAPTAVIGKNEWHPQMQNPTFGLMTVANIYGTDGTFRYQGAVIVDTPGAVNIVVREDDMAIGFIKKYRERALPNTPEIDAWRDQQNLDVFEAPQLGMDFEEIPRGWINEIGSVLRLRGNEMHEGSTGLGWQVDSFQRIADFYPNSATFSSYIPIFWGIAKRQVARTTEDEAKDLKTVIWKTPAQVLDWMAEPASCGISKGAIGIFRACGLLQSADPFFKQIAESL
jgi:hypothetical protein